MKFPSFQNIRRKLSRTALLLGLCPMAASVAGATGATDLALKDVVVTATRAEAALDSIPATVTSLGRQELDRRLPADQADLFRDDPDLAMARDQRRFGATRPNIRGLEDNRVVQLVDGVRLPDFYNGGGPTNFSMSAPLSVTTDFLKRVEVVRGASSSLYGSDAIGGVVGFVTLDPADLLGSAGKSAGRLRVSYFGANRGKSLTALGAWRGDAAELLIGLARARASETDNQGRVDGVSAARTRPNPQQAEDRGALAKLVLRPAAGHKLTAAFEGRDLSAATEVARLSTSLPKVTAMSGNDNGRRLRASLEWEHKPANGPYDRLTAHLYRQDSDTRNFNNQRRSNTSATCSASAGSGNNCNIEQEFFFTQEATGGDLKVEKMLKMGELAHLLTLGVDLSRVRTEEMRDARIRNLTSGAVTKTLAGDVFPLRDFANGTTDTVGLFFQDEIDGLAGGHLSLTPGLRYDQRQLKPEVDALARSVLTAINRQAVNQTDSAVSPKLGALWRFSPALSGYGQIARSFRAPNYNEVNGSFRNTAQSYGISPNPDLEPETGVGAELGLRYATAALRGQVAVFDNRYRNFIESVRLVCPGDARCIAGIGTTYMSLNLSSVRIRGFEMRGGWDLAPGWKADGALAFSRGDNRQTGQPLNSIEPTRLSLALARDAGAWGAEARLRGASRKSRVDDSEGVWFRPSGYAVADISVWWKIDRRAQIVVAANNLFDRKYWLWSDIRQADARNPAGVDFYSQPGRSLNVAFQSDF